MKGIDLGAGWVEDFNEFGDHDAVLLLVLKYDQTVAEVASAVLYSYRDIRDEMASIKRASGVEPDLELVEKALLKDVEWRPASLVVKYEDLTVSKVASAQAVLKALDIEGMDSRELLRELDEVSVSEADPGKGRDAETPLHAQHITEGRQGSWKEVLTRPLWRRSKSDTTGGCSKPAILTRPKKAASPREEAT